MCLNHSLSLISWIIKMNNLNFAGLLHRECENTIALKSGQRNEAERILESEPGVRALKILEVVDVDFLFKYHNNSIFAQFDIKDIGLKIELTKRPMLNVVPQNQSI